MSSTKNIMNEDAEKETRPRLPPGQRVTSRFPVLQKGGIVHIDREKYKLEVAGEVEKPVAWSLDQLKELQDEDIVADIHCVTSWSKYDTKWGGISFKKLFEEGKNLILSGSPRTLYEGEKIMPFVEKLYGKDNIKTVLLDIKPETTLHRNSNRRICELMRHSILFSKETENLAICPLDGSKLVRREGLDDPETIKVRLKEYAERTAPIFDYFKKNGLEITKVNGEQSVADVYKDVLSAIK